MPATIDFTLTTTAAQVPLRLYAEGALEWPGGQTLFITDPHFGKADAFRHAGIAIPTAILQHDLDRLSGLLRASAATTLVVLGDFFHNRHSQSESALATIAAWRHQHAGVTMTIVQGNHDAHAGPPPQEFAIETVSAPYAVGPFLCHHMPQPKALTLDAEGYVLAGHLHPYVVLVDRDGSRLRLASFIFSRNQGILPAFGGFTGGSHYPPAATDRVFAIAQGEIVEVPTTRRRAVAST